MPRYKRSEVRTQSVLYTQKFHFFLTGLIASMLALSIKFSFNSQFIANYLVLASWIGLSVSLLIGIIILKAQIELLEKKEDLLDFICEKSADFKKTIDVIVANFKEHNDSIPDKADFDQQRAASQKKVDIMEEKISLVHRKILKGIESMLRFLYSSLLFLAIYYFINFDWI